MESLADGVRFTPVPGLERAGSDNIRARAFVEGYGGRISYIEYARAVRIDSQR